MKNSKNILLAFGLCGFIYCEIKKVKIIKHIRSRQLEFANHINTNNFAISDVEGQLNDLGEELDRLDKQKVDKTLKPKNKKGKIKK